MPFTKLINNHVIFAIDNDKDFHTVAKFTRFLDTQRALGKLRYTPKIGIGSFEGVLEQSYMMCYNDYYEFVAESGYVDNQYCVLVLNPLNPRSSAHQGTLDYSDGTSEYLGTWTDVTSCINWLGLKNYTVLDNRVYTCIR